MKAKALLVVALMLVMAFAFVLPADDDDAAKGVDNITLDNGSSITVDRGKSVTLSLTYTASRNISCYISLYDQEGKTLILTQKQAFDVGEYTIEIPFTYDNHKSGAQMYLEFSDGVYDRIGFTLTYSTSIWDNWTTYAVILIIAILIIALVLYKSRMAPKEKNQLTFEQIEAMKQAERSTAKEKSAPAVKSERQRYLDSKKKN
jgi:hypothetical protein